MTEQKKEKSKSLKKDEVKKTVLSKTQKQDEAGKIVLNKPFTYEGKEYKELVVDLDSLTGNDVIALEKEARASGDRTPVLEFSKSYLAALAARLWGVPTEVVLGLSYRDFAALTMTLQDFLME